MAQGQFTKEEAKETISAVEEMYNGLSQRNKGEYLGHLNDILLFIAAAEKVAPTEAEYTAAKEAEAANQTTT